jgi:hypothetical protein
MSSKQQAAGTLSHHREPLLLAASIVAIGYGAFPLAFFLNRAHFWHGLVSGLAEADQPYGWLFNTLDAVAALLGVVLFAYLYHRLRKTKKLHRSILVFAVIASASEFLTDVIALPRGFDTDTRISAHLLLTHPIITLHGAASLANSVAFISSLGLWVYYARHTKRGAVFRTVLFVASLGIGTLGAVIGFVFPATSATLQRLFILVYSVWVFALASYTVSLLPKRNTPKGVF